MGLDSFWKAPEDHERSIQFDPPLQLCGGMFSAHGQGSFRGKVYDEVVMKITGETLYQERISNQTVREMSKRLDEHVSKAKFGQVADLIDDDLEDLARMFHSYAEAGYELLGWW